MWRRCVAGAWRLESPTEDGACFPKATAVDLGVSRVKSKKVDLQKLLKLLSAKMPVMWKPMTQSIRRTWNNLLSKANVLADLKQESW